MRMRRCLLFQFIPTFSAALFFHSHSPLWERKREKYTSIDSLSRVDDFLLRYVFSSLLFFLLKNNFLIICGQMFISFTRMGWEFFLSHFEKFSYNVRLVAFNAAEIKLIETVVGNFHGFQWAR